MLYHPQHVEEAKSRWNLCVMPQPSGTQRSEIRKSNRCRVRHHQELLHAVVCGVQRSWGVDCYTHVEAVVLASQCASPVSACDAALQAAEFQSFSDFPSDWWWILQSTELGLFFRLFWDCLWCTGCGYLRCSGIDYQAVRLTFGAQPYLVLCSPSSSASSSCCQIPRVMRHQGGDGE